MKKLIAGDNIFEVISEHEKEHENKYQALINKKVEAVCERCGEKLNDENRCVLPIATAPDDYDDREFCKSCADNIEEGGNYYE